ncbi:hypothetical protein AGMMS49992_30700 [Clostridia bacterium]|nr:hypothetical protein AGMMS49992_30700 [Clostridia bacterium]
MSCNCSYPLDRGHAPAYHQRPNCPAYPNMPIYQPCPAYPYKPHYPALPPQPCPPCGMTPNCCYPPNVIAPPQPDCCGDMCDDDPNNRPCCRNGCCAGCQEFTGNLPYLMPRAIGCGKVEKCKTAYCLPLDPDCLDQGDLPGRPPHTIVCVRNTGASVVEECLEEDNADDLYDLYVRIKIPVEIIIRDCAGFTHCLKSWFAEKVKIPLTKRVKCLPKHPLIYAKATVSLCYPTRSETEVKDLTAVDADYDYLDVCGEEDLGDSFISFDHCPKLQVKVVACVIKLVPCGSANDPYVCRPQVLPCKPLCDVYPMC